MEIVCCELTSCTVCLAGQSWPLLIGRTLEQSFSLPLPMVLLRLLPRRDLATLRCDAIATSSNGGLVGNANPTFWRFAGRENADGAVHRAAGRKLLVACAEAIREGGGHLATGGVAVTPSCGALASGLVLHAVAPDGAYAVGLQQWWGRRP